MLFDHCRIAIIDDDPARAVETTRVLERCGLRAGTVDEADVIVVMPSAPVPALGQVPVLIVGRPLGAPLPAGVDGALPTMDDAAEFVAAVRAWLPPANHAIERLLAVFGSEEIAALATRLHQRLTMVAALDGPPGANDSHQLAGFAGMLGYGAVSDSFRRLSEGDESAWMDARRDARLAIVAIERSGLSLLAD